MRVVKNEMLLKFVMAMDGMRDGFLEGDFENLWKCLKEDVMNVYNEM